MVDAVRTPIDIDGLRPREVVSPTTAEQLAEALHRADQDGLAVAPVGGATQLDLGNPPARLDLAIQTTGLNRVVEYEPADLTVTVEAGLRFDELQQTLGEQGQMLALDPPAAPEATIGGLVATNASGPLRFAHGTARDLVIGSFELFSSQIAIATNIQMRVLTFATVVLGILACFAGILGMNFDAPFFHTSGTGFWVASGAMAVLAIVAIVIGKAKRWM